MCFLINQKPIHLPKYDENKRMFREHRRRSNQSIDNSSSFISNVHDSSAIFPPSYKFTPQPSFILSHPPLIPANKLQSNHIFITF